MIIRYTPELIFVSDRNIAYGVHIAKVLADTMQSEDHEDGRDEAES
jgi:ribosome-binding factor A